MRFKALLFILLMSLGVTSGQAATTSYDNTFTAEDVFSSDFHTKLNENFTRSLTGGINSINGENIVDDSLGEADMADEINPRVRTYESASCEFVYTGLLPSTDTDLTVDIPAGTAYPRGYRCVKSSATAHTFTASKWTYLDIDQNCDFQYTEVAIDASAPAVASNAIRIARVSSDATTVPAVTDLRTTSCASGPFENIADATGEATLEDLFATGSPIRQSSSYGFIQGLQTTWDTHTAFKVMRGGAYIGGRYRIATDDISVSTTDSDSPSLGGSGIDTGAIAASTRYNIWAVADEDNVNSLSVTYGTGSTPSGVTYYRKIGEIKTDGSSLFSSRDIAITHAISERQVSGGWAVFDGTAGTLTPYDSYNVSSLTDNSTGDFTVTWDRDFNNKYYSISCLTGDSGGDNVNVTCTLGRIDTEAPTYGTATFFTGSTAANNRADQEYVSVTAIGDRRE